MYPLNPQRLIHTEGTSVMIARHVHQAIEEVRDLRQKILEGQRFRGYSGRARAVSGTLALMAAAILSTPWIPGTERAHAVGWGICFVLACLVNYGALLYWFLFDPEAKRDVRRLGPTTDALPPFFAGGLLTWALILHGHYDLLFGVWMALFGVANLATRRALPKANRPLGWAYVLAGAFCLISPVIHFTNPWPMGLVFFVGEWTGGLILHYGGLPHVSINSLLNPSKERPHVRPSR